ncbi:MAG TPA: hypothetical protein ENN23_06295 [Deltaproteobacteria bacterium]|nr:hypothetical protein [Deltaproteobacteria bacterium]
MNKLNKRQIIVLSIAGLFVLYAAYVFLIASPAEKRSASIVKPDELNNFVGDLQADLLRDIAAGVDSYVIARAEKNWDKNLFWDSRSYRDWVARDAVAARRASAGMVYSGYVDSGKRKLAIINGYEYRVGEELEMEGYLLKSITPSMVVIFNKNTGNEIEVPIQE